MVYIPKSQIKENQFTSGGEWYFVKNDLSYTGFYYTLSNGGAFTGATPNDTPSEKIYQKTAVVSSQQKNYPLLGEAQTVKYAGAGRSRNLKIYGILVDTDYNLERSLPQLSYTIPTPEDYEKGMFTRYFLVKVNQPIFLEVNEDTYNNIETKNEVWMWEDYIPFTLKWYIKGNIDTIFKSNKGLIFVKEQSIERKGLEEYLEKQYLEYFEYPEADNLTTLGNEFLTPFGLDYVGPYHINKIQGPMEGSTHIQGAHTKLFYKRFYRGEIVDALNQEGVIETGETQRIEFTNDLTVEYDVSSQMNTTPSQMNTTPSTGGGY
tara:strand:- start:287 stop:1243 length:957 start_codon:yes stop_codon:yes gene_type:complete